MVKFKVLKYNESILLKLGIVQHRFPKKMAITGFFKSPIVYYTLSLSVTFTVSCALFVYQNLMDFNAALRASLFIVGTFQTTGMLISFHVNATNMREVHLKLQELAEGITFT